jgi:hypothetical protein
MTFTTTTTQLLVALHFPFTPFGTGGSCGLSPFAAM